MLMNLGLRIEITQANMLAFFENLMITPHLIEARKLTQHNLVNRSHVEL